ncbi:PREDICTED: zinc finger protein 622-like [Priapulus caudatus]|uniref:Zinc finger protein 622-like n=1 Tax=Priapulus caudatus TaxID=37621 RepID=A0ABM1EBP2_PRICU|nr:PREDICTED: zinc finger protein 622-like [Priapulus caudatus]
MSVHTCITCRVVFATSDFQRSHYKSDWHRYNLKRKVAELPAVNADAFKERVLAQRAKVEGEEKKGEVSFYCSACNKLFGNNNAFQNHIGSRKHKEMEASDSVKKKSVIKQKNHLNLEKGMTETGKHSSVTKRVEESTGDGVQSVMDTTSEPSAAPSASSSATGGISGAMKSKMRAPEPAGRRLKESDADHDDMGSEDDVDDWEDVEGDEEDEEAEEGEEVWLGDPILPVDCLFCPHHSSSVEQNVSHMSRDHSFFIPDVEYLVDTEGLITYLGEKVGMGNVCLWCNERGKGFHSTHSVQQHMYDKGHCKMLFTGDAVFEYSDYYDYRSSYPDHKEVEGTEAEQDEEVDLPALAEQYYALVLPSGASIGHRSLLRYYRQNPPQKERPRRGAVSKVLGQYRALGWTGNTSVRTPQQMKDIGYLQRARARYYTQLGQKGNSILQKHYRSQNPI